MAQWRAQCEQWNGFKVKWKMRGATYGLQRNQVVLKVLKQRVVKATGMQVEGCQQRQVCVERPVSRPVAKWAVWNLYGKRKLRSNKNNMLGRIQQAVRTNK